MSNAAQILKRFDGNEDFLTASQERDPSVFVDLRLSAAVDRLTPLASRIRGSLDIWENFGKIDQDVQFRLPNPYVKHGMAHTEDDLLELIDKRIKAAFAEEKDRKLAWNRARVNLRALTISSGDRPGVRTLEQVAKYLAENPREHSLQTLREKWAPRGPKPEWKPPSF